MQCRALCIIYVPLMCAPYMGIRIANPIPLHQCSLSERSEELPSRFLVSSSLAGL